MLKKTLTVFLAALCFVSSNLYAGEEPGQSPIAWQAWSKDVFQKAQAENKMVFLDLEAVWCHWCHVMDQTTYREPKVAELLGTGFIAVRADQDANPELSHRYEDYGWPATVIFNAQGEELVKRRGYIPPDAMASMLQAVIDDPTPGPSVRAEEKITPSENAFLSPELAAMIKKNHSEIYDKEFGGWGEIHKLISSDELEYAMAKTEEGDAREEEMARRTLDQALHLLDSVWGGFYQYSDERDWKSPHFEKIMQIQAEYIRLYAKAFSLWQKPGYLEAAMATARYLRDFLTSPEGAFYTSQDADVDAKIDGPFYYAFKDQDRRKLGLPRVDQHIYARENGWAITGLCALYDATGDEAYLEQAIRAARWVLANRALEGGGFRHDQADPGGPFLGDTLAMGQAFLALYASTADRQWLEKAGAAFDFIEKNFKDTEAGFITAPADPSAVGVLKNPVRQVDQNIAMSRFSNLLFHYTGQERFKEAARHAMRYLASPVLIKSRKFLAGILLADREIAQDPVHVAVVGSKKDPGARALFLAGLRYPAAYKRIEWWDKSEGPMPNPDLQYPELPKPAAFACALRQCSLPVFDPGKLPAALDRLKQRSLTSGN